MENSCLQWRQHGLASLNMTGQTKVSVKLAEKEPMRAGKIRAELVLKHIVKLVLYQWKKEGHAKHYCAVVMNVFTPNNTEPKYL